ncbi:uncharacterized protein THITE_2116870 [Thermothielavioides terrestris NRRL 8126]|uniref:t-SNARE coiled-coil homology domain-containing protein n=2 Tax=Thermothielavioides terrestris TaxID=2587410 RepID=G2R784_THETT|nr:uncharacterized protein THITE_2116870 [Thermothielavioides terrestris NRRL 8126]AEO67793.1 hypothetical protein THITE_2116870 [Thermothielavioides terrestris NRRL 8126]
MASSPSTNEPAILRECREVQNGIQNVERMLRELPAVQKRFLADADTSNDSEAKRKLDLFRQDIMDQYRKLADRVRKIKSMPESRQPMYTRQVERVEGRLRDAIQEFQKLEAVFRKETEARLGRQLRIVRPEATDAEIRAAVEEGNTQVFQQAVLGNRSEQASRVLGAVQQRHREMLQIERSMMELLELLNDMQELLTKQEVTINEIDTHAEQAAGDMVKANEELEVAVATARKTRKKKWICLGICVLIVVIVVVVVVAYIMVNRAASGKKRSLFIKRNVVDELQMNTARAVQISADSVTASQHPRSADADLTAAPRHSRRRSNAARGVRMGRNTEVELSNTKRFIVDWHGIDPTDSDK